MLIKKNNNKGESKMEYKKHKIKPADNFGKDYLIYFNNLFIKGCSSIEQAKTFIDKKIKERA
jgi:hypothetical protein